MILSIITRFAHRAIVLALVCGAVVIPANASCLSPANRIEAENCLPGTPESTWKVSGTGDATIQGFATDFSVSIGQTVYFKINTDASAYTIDIYRLGYYGKAGARKVASITPSVPLPQSQSACVTDTGTGLYDCGNWGVSASWAVPSTAVSGIYFARLTRTDTGGASHVFFVVRDDTSVSTVIFQTSDATWQAYNDYGGLNLYLGAHKVSYNRPFHTYAVNP